MNTSEIPRSRTVQNEDKCVGQREERWNVAILAGSVRLPRVALCLQQGMSSCISTEEYVLVKIQLTGA
jgi:hypothetical protein